MISIWSLLVIVPLSAWFGFAIAGIIAMHYEEKCRKDDKRW